ncbi:MAG TPA: hypothetical protein VK447_10280 [Myxococcaceae bacterium]|nr:hypothetical protein [Myxococcaceae bacterium]
MRRALLVLLLLSCPLASAEEAATAVKPDATPAVPAVKADATPAPAVMLVWGGGATRQEADAALKDYQTRSKPWRGAIELGEDFPKVLESGTVPGLNPGFFVVALGVCAPDAAEEPLTAYKGIEPNVYSREVTWPALKADSCPKVGEFWTGPAIHRVKRKGLELTGVFFSFAATQGEIDNQGWWLLLHLRDDKGNVLQTELVFPEADWSEVKSFEPKGAGLVVTDKYALPSCVRDSRYKAFKRSITFTIGGKKIERRDKERKVAEGECGGG